MAYIRRHAEKAVDELKTMFGAVLVTGARQVGKSTLLEHMTQDIPRLTMDNAAVYAASQNAPETFFTYNNPPLFIDEIQKAPNLFPEIKQVIDSRKGKGLFFMSGSEQFSMMENVAESLSGRVGIVNLMGLSMREASGTSFESVFVPTRPYFGGRQQAGLAVKAADDIWGMIHRGDKPELAANRDYDWSKYYGAYLRTYIERDVRKLANIGDELKFQNFMTVVAARTAQVLNYSDIAKDADISVPTAQRWISVLRTSGIVYLMRPWFVNISKRAIKSPKLYITDTGLAAYLTQWTSPGVLRSGAMAGAFFETFVVCEVLKSYYNSGQLDPPIYYFRDADKLEIDLLIHSNGQLHPLEIKSAGLGRISDIKAFKLLDGIPNLERGHGGVVCLADTLQPLSHNDAIIPVGYI
jgi:predicted AAA+ superfamily ATPase